MYIFLKNQLQDNFFCSQICKQLCNFSKYNSLTSDMGKKTLSALTHSLFLPQRANSGYIFSISPLRYSIISNQCATAWRVNFPSQPFVAEQICVLQLILSSSPYLRSAKARFPLNNSSFSQPLPPGVRTKLFKTHFDKLDQDILNTEGFQTLNEWFKSYACVNK